MSVSWIFPDVDICAQFVGKRFAAVWRCAPGWKADVGSANSTSIAICKVGEREGKRRYNHTDLLSPRDRNQIPKLRCEGGIAASALVDDQRTPAIRVAELRRKCRQTPRKDLIIQNLQSQQMNTIMRLSSLETINTSHVTVTHGSDMIEVKFPPPPRSPPLLSLGERRRGRRREAPSPVLRRSAEPARPAASSSQACKRRESQLKNQRSL